MADYLTVKDTVSAEHTEKRSKFIATLKHCETDQEAVAFIDEMRTRYWDARHNVYAYCVDGGRLCRFSDDGEPHGTAGKPVLDVIKGAELRDVAIVVTRYFGGILLGTGGLVRAYSKAAKLAVDNAQIYEMIPCTVYETVCEYQDHARLLKLVESANGSIENTDFTDKIKLKYALRDCDAENFKCQLSETFSAKLEAVEVCTKNVPFAVEKVMQTPT